ncbi:hypothetical protein SDC9_164037 [bioreactor metagenome]|uniref:Uncharacterized protein n=1 Tax=bioreactor metagenome TaxID=1076179 RepID=A0A645FST9_9ZZZZ
MVTGVSPEAARVGGVAVSTVAAARCRVTAAADRPRQVASTSPAIIACSRAAELSYSRSTTRTIEAGM